MNGNSPLKIIPIKGYPMLYWFGKKPLGVVKHFLARYLFRQC